MAKQGENIYKSKVGHVEGRYKNGFNPDGRTRYSFVYGKSYSETRCTLLQKKQSANTTGIHCNFKLGKVVQT